MKSKKTFKILAKELKNLKLRQQPVLLSNKLEVMIRSSVCKCFL